mgnify:CR=1 FL=1
MQQPAVRRGPVGRQPRGPDEGHRLRGLPLEHSGRPWDRDKTGSLLQQSTRNHPGVAIHGNRARSLSRSTGTIWRKIQRAMW